MKIGSTLSSSTETSGTKFSIKATGKAFRILSSGLYKEKILAIVRELSCNAYDAHIAAGYPDRPFDVHLPTHAEPYFSVRDYGRALTPVQMDTVFTTYFESTKSDSNTEIGGLGLGCKSPFSYVDEFKVISRHEGVRREYRVFFDATDTPSISMTKEAPILRISELQCDGAIDNETSLNNFSFGATSNEPDGLEVIVEVQPSGFREFREKAEQVYRYFGTPPNILGVNDFKLVRPKVLLEGETFTITDQSPRAIAVMGTVAYPISPTLSVHQDLSRLFNSPVTIEFAVGDLEVTAGREELSYDPTTRERLAERGEKIIQEMITSTLQKFRACSSEFEARYLYGKIVSPFSCIRALFPEGRVPYKSTLINSTSFTISLDQLKQVTLLRYGYSSKPYKFDIQTYSETSRLITVPCSDNLKVFYEDGSPRDTSSRMRLYRDSHPHEEVIVVRCTDEGELEKLRAILNGVEFVPITTLARAPRIARQPTRALRLDYDYRVHGRTIYRRDWKLVHLNGEESGLFVAMTHNRVHNDKGEDVQNQFSDFCKLSTGLGLIPSAPIYGIPKSLMPRFSKQEGWSNLFTQVREEFTTRMLKENWSGNIGKAAALLHLKTNLYVNRSRSVFLDSRCRCTMLLRPSCDTGTIASCRPAMIPIPCLRGCSASN